MTIRKLLFHQAVSLFGPILFDRGCSVLHFPTPLREKCSNTEFFLVRIFPHLDWIRRDTEWVSLRIQSKCRKIQSSKNSVFGHFSRSAHTFNSCFSENELTWYSFFLSKEMIFSCKRYKHQLQHFLLLQQVFMPRSSHKVEGRELSVD